MLLKFRGMDQFKKQTSPQPVFSALSGSETTRTNETDGATGGRAFGVLSVVAALIVPVWALIAMIAGGLTTLAWLPVLLVYVLPYNLVYLALVAAATTFGILAIRRRTGRRLGQAGLTIVAIQVIALVAYAVWALIDRVPA